MLPAVLVGLAVTVKLFCASHPLNVYTIIAVPGVVPTVKVAVALFTVPTPEVEVELKLHTPPGVVVARVLVVTPSAHMGVIAVLLSGEFGEEIVILIGSKALSQVVATDFTFTFLTTVPLLRLEMIIWPLPFGVRF